MSGYMTDQAFANEDSAARGPFDSQTQRVSVTAASRDQRTENRHPAQPEHMVEFPIKGHPIYQLKLQDVSELGAGAIVRRDSKLLTLIAIGQQLTVKLLTPGGDADPVPGTYQVRLAHITESKVGRFKGHMVIGIELLEKYQDRAASGRLAQR